MADEIGDRGWAFPSVDANEPSVNGARGMSLRDYFAASALQGDLGQRSRDDMDANYWYSAKIIAKRAYEIADAMLQARKK